MEFALVLPLLLALIVGGAGVGLLLLHRSELTHAAQELATEAAVTDCAAALTRVADLLGYQPNAAQCDKQGQLVTVDLAHNFPALVPFLPDTVRVEARALVH